MNAKPHTSCSFDHPADWPCSICSPADPTEQTAGELRRLRQDVWDALGILGFDHDGDKTPDHLVYPPLGTVLLDYAREVRASWDEALDEIPSMTAVETLKRLLSCEGEALDRRIVYSPAGTIHTPGDLLAYLLGGEQ